MRFKLILLVLPLLFAPNVGLAVDTLFGTIAPSDWVIPVLYLLLLPDVFKRPNRPFLPPWVAPAFMGFLIVTLAATAIIPLRYTVMRESDRVTLFGLLKISKFAMYGLFGYLLAAAMDTEDKIRRVKKSFWIGCALMAGTVVYSALTGWQTPSGGEMQDAMLGTKSSLQEGLFSSNSTSVAIAAALSYWLAEYYFSRARIKWNLQATFLGLLGMGMFLTMGRGGWVAGIVGVGYVFLRRPNPRTIAWVTGAGFGFLLLMIFFEPVKVSFLTTVMADKYYSDRTSDIGQKYGVDDGGRITIFRNHFRLLKYNPFIGVGFYNRTPDSLLSPTGSHNFFLQMALETGLIGLFLLVVVLYSMFKHATTRLNLPKADRRYLGEPLRACIVAVCIGCMSGEYLYGGWVIMILSIVFAFNCCQKREIYKRYYSHLAARDPLMAQRMSLQRLVRMYEH